jgi:hypothetical protein
MPRPLSQDTACSQHNIFVLTLSLSEGQAGEACETFNRMMLFLPPHNKLYLTFHIISHFIYSSTIISTFFSRPIFSNHSETAVSKLIGRGPDLRKV